MKVLICGSRNYDEWRTVQRALSTIHRETPVSLVVTGGAPGADRLAQKWAEGERIPVAVFPANWNHLGKRAGPMRNAWMLEFMAPDLVVAFPGGPGTRDMVDRAAAAGVPVQQAPNPPTQTEEPR